ncbi:unnamed protein product [Notodromas monacha]|uniref:Vacuolar ATPase assembly protein VMA22 n=1 Tax=Notodromas monacha TaxID=399045 RepID=A0A7R9GCV7_9CRUS|nr:unnamed protein product [Notodromas monacha]CAG0916262.1 unnamed protein product [Notodromas monacha]
MAAGKHLTETGSNQELQAGFDCDEMDMSKSVAEDRPSVSVEEITILAYRDMLQAMAYPYGILTLKQVKLAKTFGKLLRIPEARQKLEMRAVYVSLESKRDFKRATEELSVQEGTSSSPVTEIVRRTGNKIKKRKEKRPRRTALELSVPSAAASASPCLHSLADVGSVVPPFLRPTPVTQLEATVERVVEIYRGKIRALWRDQGSHRHRRLARNAEISAISAQMFRNIWKQLITPLSLQLTGRKMKSESLRMMDALAMRALYLMNEIIVERGVVEDSLKNGFIEMAQARYVMGSRSVSSLKFPSEMVASCVVESETKKIGTLDGQGDHSAPMFDERSLTSQLSVAPEETNPSDSPEKEGGLRHRKGELESGDANEKSTDEKPLTMSGKDPLKWFGVLVDANLRRSQKNFKSAVARCVHLVNLQAELVRVVDEFRRLRASSKEASAEE